MALIAWDDEEKKKEDLFGTPIKSVASVQSGAWQPAPSGADAPAVVDEEPQQGGIFGQKPQPQAQPVAQENYLVSDEKAQFDEAKRRRDIEIENARRQAAAEAAAAQAAQSASFQEGDVETRDGQQINVDEVKQDTGWKKYYEKAFKQEKDQLDFWGRLLDGGQASKRGESAARAKYSRELMRQGFDQNGAVVDQGKIDQVRKLNAYNSAFAGDLSNKAAALVRATGADRPNIGFLDKVKATINNEKTMSLYDALFGVNNEQKTEANDAGRFLGGLVQGIPTMPFIGAKELSESATGRGTNWQTGMEEDLTPAERIGRGVSGGLNVVTPFVGGSGKLLDSVTTQAIAKTVPAAERMIFEQLLTKAATIGVSDIEEAAMKQVLGTAISNTAEAASKSALQKLTSKLFLPALEQGAIGGTQTGAEYFGNGNTLTDENGNFDKNKAFELTKQVGESAGMGVAGGLVMGGAAMGVNHIRGRGVPELSPADLADIEGRATVAGEAELANTRALDTEGANLQALEAGDVTPVREPVADGVVQDVVPIKEEVSRPQVETPQSELLPIGERNDLIDSSANDITPVSKVQVIKDKVQAVRDRLKLKDEAGGNAGSSDEPTIINDLTGQEIPNPAYKPVADGVAEVTPVKNIPQTDVTPIKSEEVRALEESKVGKSQADEAAINQELQQLEAQTPRYYHGGTPLDAESIRQSDLGYSVSADKNVSKWFTNTKDGGNVSEHTISPDAKILETKDIPQELLDGYSKLDPNKSLIENIKNAPERVKDAERKIVAYAKANGYDAIDMRGEPFVLKGDNVLDNEAEVRVLNPDILDVKPEPPTTKTLPEDVTPAKSVKVPEASSLPEGMTPVGNSLPDDMGVGSAVVDPKPLTRQQVAERLMPKLADNSDVKTRIAESVGMGKDAASPIRDILRDGKVEPKRAEKVATQFEALEKLTQDYNRLEEANQKAYAEKGTEGLDENTSRERSRTTREMGTITRRLMTEIKRMEGSKDFKAALMNNVVDVLGTRNANVLTSAGLIERNIMQEITANAKLAIKNPIKMAKSTFQNGNILKDTAKSELSHWGDKPSANPIEVVKYIVGNTYRTAMIPTTALANTRRGAVRDELTKWAYQALEGRSVSSKEAHKLAGTAGNELEALVNTVIGADNGMTNRGQAKKAIDEWKEYIKTGDDGAKAKFLERVEQHNSLADQMISGLSGDDALKAKGLMAMKNLIFPFVRTATNLAKTAVQQDLNPFAKSLLDDIRADQLSKGANAINIIKSKLVDYGIMGGAAALATSGVLAYNDGDEIDRPRGWSIKTGENSYVPIRSTSLELPIAMAGTAQAIASDIASGKTRDAKYYGGMISNSLPYIDQFNTTTGAVDSLMSGEDSGYAAKSYGVNMAKSFVPGSNNGVQPYVAGKKGESLNAKTVYDKNMWQWFKNTIQKSYDPDFYNNLKDSRDNAGRVRTVDNQGIISNKKINDVSTAEFNDRITDLVNYSRENKLGKNTQDMFNTYDTGENNNFKSVQDSITFLDAPEVDGKKTPDNTKKLEKNDKLIDLSAQIRDGFFGETGSELLTLNGENLYSDVSIPNKNGTKNSKLPLNMQTIKNAIAQTDLPEDQRNKMYEISQANDALYAQMKAKSLTYDQYSAAKAKNEETYVDILSGSENYKKLLGLMDELDQSGFFNTDGLGSTKSGQTYLWNLLNTLLGSKGATPAANYPDDSKGFTPWGRGGGRGGSGRGATNKPGDRNNKGIQWTPVGKRQMAQVGSAKYTPVNIKVKLNNAVKKDKSQNYSDRTI